MRALAVSLLPILLVACARTGGAAPMSSDSTESPASTAPAIAPSTDSASTDVAAVRQLRTATFALG